MRFKENQIRLLYRGTYELSGGFSFKGARHEGSAPQHASPRHALQKQLRELLLPGRSSLEGALTSERRARLICHEIGPSFKKPTPSGGIASRLSAHMRRSAASLVRLQPRDSKQSEFPGVTGPFYWKRRSDPTSPGSTSANVLVSSFSRRTTSVV
jgi:hypothetical protein